MYEYIHPKGKIGVVKIGEKSMRFRTAGNMLDGYIAISFGYVV